LDGGVDVELTRVDAEMGGSGAEVGRS
jgi:hypothetical protein